MTIFEVSKTCWTRTRVSGRLVSAVIQKTFCVSVITATLFIATDSWGENLQPAKIGLRDDAFRLMGAGMKVPGVAAYCEKKIESNPALMKAAQAWNERHHEILVKIIAVIEWSGGMSQAERETFDRLAYRLLNAEMESEPDKAAHCRKMQAMIHSGEMDMDKSPITAAAARRIMSSNVK